MLPHCRDRLQRGGKNVVPNAEQCDSRPPQGQQRQRCKPWRHALEGGLTHDAFPRLMWWRQSCTYWTKVGSKVVSSERGRGSSMVLEATTRPGRALIT